MGRIDFVNPLIKHLTGKDPEAAKAIRNVLDLRLSVFVIRHGFLSWRRLRSQAPRRRRDCELTRRTFPPESG